MGADKATMEGIFKDVFEPTNTRNIAARRPLKDLIKPKTADWKGGRQTIYATRVSQNQGVMASREDATIVDAGNPVSVQFTIDQRKIVGRTRYTYEAMEDSKGSEAAFVSVYKDGNDDLVDMFVKKNEQFLTLDGRGILGLVDEASPTGNTTLEMDAPGGIAGDNFGNRFVSKGMIVALVNPATGALRASSIVKVTGVNSDGTDITLSAAPTNGADNDYVVQAANTGISDVNDTGYQAAPMGLLGIFDDGTYLNNYFGVDRSLYPQLQSYVKSSTGAMSVDLFQLLSDIVDQRMDGRVTDLAMHHSTRRPWLQITENDRRYATEATLKNPNPGTAAMDQEPVSIGTARVHAFRYMPLTMIFGLDIKGSEIYQYVSEPGSWWNPGDGILQRVGTGTSAKQAVEAVYFQRHQYHARYPGKSWRADGVTGQTLTVVRPAGD